jgi:hypothetical protein
VGERFNGTINVDIRDSAPDWTPFEPPRAPDGAPSVVYIVLDANGIPDDIQANLAMLDELGGTKTYNHYPNGWAMAFNTPFKMWKRYEFNGGTADPCILSWPPATGGKGGTTRAITRTSSPAARSSESPSTSAATLMSTSSARPRQCSPASR